MNVRRHARIAEGADQDGVEISCQGSEAIWRDGNSVGEITVGSPVERGQFDWRTGGLHDFYSLRNDFFSDAVTGYHGNTLGQAHAGNVSTAVKCLCRDGACSVSLVAETRQAASLQEIGSA